MNREWDDPEESRRFLETTNEVEMSDDPKDFDRALKKVAPHREKYTRYCQVNQFVDLLSSLDTP